MRTLSFLLLAGFGFFSLAALAQTTVHVPAEQPTIQSAIDAAQNGDTVLVAPGTYQENVDFKGKAITVTSGATSSAGATATIIEAPGTDPVVSFVTSETPAAVLNGFTLTHSSNLQTTNFATADGIGIVKASPTITNNVILNNPGCGIGALEPPALVLQGNTITSAAGGGCGEIKGTDFSTSGAIVIDGIGTGAIQILDNTIVDYHGAFIPSTSQYENRGILIQQVQSVLLRNNIITGNTGTGNSIFVEDTSSVALVQNLIYANAGISTEVYIQNFLGHPLSAVMTNNTIVTQGQDPSSPVYQPEVGAALFFIAADSVTSTISNNLFSTLGGGNAVACEFFSGGASAPPPSSATFAHNDVYQPGNTSSYQCALPANTIANISADPQFIDLSKGNLHVQPSSAIVAAGDPNAPLIPSTDLAGKNRFVCGTVDMGVYQVHPRPATVVTSSNNPSVGGSSVTFNATVPGNCNVPTGTVTFVDGTTPLGTVALSPSATASISTSALTVGTHTITVTYPGDFNFYKSTSAPLTQTVTGYPTATTLTIAPNPAGAFTPITLTSTVSSSFGQPTGTVVFTAGGQTLASAAVGVSGVAVAAISSLGTGSYPIVATYQASTTFASSSSAAVNETVVGAESVTSLNASPNPAGAGQSVTFTANVRAAQGSAIPTGTLTFSDGVTVLGSASLNANGTATFSTASLAIGAHTISASYGGSSNFDPSSASITETITAIATTTALSAAPNPAGQGQTVTLTATVTAAFGGTPGGSVTFADGTSLGTATLNASGVATFTISTLSIGTHGISALYAGSGGSFGGSTSPVVQETIVASGFNLSLSPATINVRVGQSASTTVQLGSFGNYTGTMTLIASSLPSYLSASFSPSQVSVGSTGTSKSALTISTAIVPVAVAKQTTSAADSKPLLASALATLLLAPFAFRRRRRISSLAVIVLCLVMLGTLSACGGIVEIPVHFVTPGTYVIPVTATDINNTSKTAQLTVVVMP